MDFLDDRGRMESPFKDWVLSYLDEVPDGSEDYDAHIVGVTDCGRYCTLRIDSNVKEAQLYRHGRVLLVRKNVRLAWRTCHTQP